MLHSKLFWGLQHHGSLSNKNAIQLWNNSFLPIKIKDTASSTREFQRLSLELYRKQKKAVRRGMWATHYSPLHPWHNS